jgi:hypothetical protein
MRPTKTSTVRRDWIAAGLLAMTLAAAAYLLLSGRLGFTSDDWYLIYAGLTGGIAKFQDVFASDRPFRAYFAGPVFSLFGLRPQLYLLLSYALRVGGALAFYWLLHLVWPKLGRFKVALAALFVLYPGWTDQVIPFDIQAHLLGVASMLASFALSIRARTARRITSKIMLIIAGVAGQLLALGMMEYYIGMEGLRFLLLALPVLDRRPLNAFKPGWQIRWKRLATAWLPYLLGATAFMFWRIYLFNNTRGATDISAMVAGVVGSPLIRSLWAAVYLIQDFFSVTVLAWVIPLYQQSFNLRLRESLIGLGLGLAMGLITWCVLGQLKPGGSSTTAGLDQATGEQDRERADGLEMMWIGCLGVLAALAPVALGSRHIVFPLYSRFTLPASPAGILVLGGALLAFGLANPRRQAAFQRWAPALLVSLAIIAHYGNAVHAAEGWETVQNFWWQISWRSPQIVPETVLAADYAATGILEDYYVWGPANLIYYPERYTVGDIDRTPLAAVLLAIDNVQNIQMNRAVSDRERRGLTSTQNFSHLLLLSMPSESSCVHLLDGRAPELSDQESSEMSLAAPYSRMERVQTDGPSHIPPAELFGGEPAHNWCYYYQKASLARQRGDWAEVVRLGDEATHLNERPADRVEWMPFIQAYAYLDRYEDVDQLATILNDIPFLKFQACDVFTRDLAGYGTEFPRGQRYLQEKFCH